ncbi:tumor susceptibility gene 101 protein-like isoform X2 [Mercenaria mercenaria]|uniref:tumor susceptibility gene 101 protein-like isoform X2 n=1 Tax=Mercenaria mercenaria TaxID=6596 RepID=UPI00234EB642|nr:tumor susceptibility gene 101 protein-like isoform X2 [Mercenaria mercenaria]
MADYEQALTSSIHQLKYEQADLVKSDVLNAFSVFVDLEHTEEIFGSEYNVPISIWLSKRHPFRPPIVYVTPTSRMHVMSGNFVDMNGKVNIPYLTDWNYPSSDLLSLIQIMTTVFSDELPVRGKSLSKSCNCDMSQSARAALNPEGSESEVRVHTAGTEHGRNSPGVSSDDIASFELAGEVHGRLSSRDPNRST